MILLLLPACHLFGSAAIDCTRDELPDCAGRPDTAAEGDADTDADSDSDSDSDPPEPERALVISAAGEEWGHVRQVHTDDRVAWTWSERGLPGGVIASDGERTLHFSGTQGLWVLPEGTTPGPTLPAQALDVVFSGQFWVATANGLGNEDGDIFPSAVTIKGIAPDGEGGLWVLTNTRNVASAWAFDGEDLSVLEADFDSGNARSVDIFVGPGGEPHTCSAAGGVFPLAGLASGDTTPERVASGGVTDVVACGYDPGTDEMILFSTSRGALRVEPGGAARVVAAPPEGTTLKGAGLVVP